MKIPQKIEKLLEKREKLAYQLLAAESELTDWLSEKGADFGNPDICDSVISGCMIYAEPTVAKNNVREYILEKL